MHRFPRIRIVEAGLIGIAIVLLGELGASAIGSLLSSGHWWLLAPAVTFGIVGADFGTGAVHWFGDRFFNERTPVVGPMLIRPFREHHSDPEAMTRHGLLELHGNSCIPVIIVLGVVRLLPGDSACTARLGFDLWLWVLLTASMATNQLHMWAHATSVPAAARWLQRRGVILPPERHARHHRGDFDRSYCLTTGWLNPALDRIDFFGSLERGIRNLAGPIP